MFSIEKRVITHDSSTGNSHSLSWLILFHVFSGLLQMLMQINTLCTNTVLVWFRDKTIEYYVKHDDVKHREGHAERR